jgi:outer membrane protein assembly factor BamB
MVIYCKNCNKENSRTDKFCINCGSPLDIISDNIQHLTQGGRKIWSFRTDTWGYLASSKMDGWGYMGVYSSPCVADGRVYAGCCARRLYCIDGKEGRKVWDFEIGNIFPFFKGVESSPCISDGYIYFGCNDGNLYCLDTGKRGITAGNTLSGQS